MSEDRPSQDFDKEELKKEMDLKVRNHLQQGDAFDDLVKHFLDGFAYRYIETPLSKNIETIKHDDGTFSVSGLENRLVEALKVSDPQLKEKLVKFAKEAAINKDLKATVMYRIEVKVVEGSPDSCGKIEARAIVNWNYPQHETNQEKEYIKKSQLEFEDIMVIRNKLALHLEEVANLFL